MLLTVGTLRKKWLIPNRVNCLFDVIDQSDNYVKLFTEQSIYAQGTRGLKRYGEEKTCFSLGRSVHKCFVVSLLSDQLEQPEGTVDVA